MPSFKSELAWVEDNLGNTGVPVYLFPGDDRVEVPYADALTYDPEGNRTPIIAARGTITSALDYEAEIDNITFERVKRTTFAIEGVDEYLDEKGLSYEERVRRHELGMTVIRNIFSPTPTESLVDASLISEEGFPEYLYGLTRYWGNSARTIPEPYHSKVEEHALGCIELSQEKMTAQNSKQYAELVYRESQQCGLLWAATAWSNQEAGSESQFEEFSNWLGRFVGRISLFGAALDMHKDYKDNRMGFKPRVIHDGRLLIHESFVDKEVFSPRKLVHYALKFIS
jgi:hypothetical protein